MTVRDAITPLAFTITVATGGGALAQAPAAPPTTTGRPTPALSAVPGRAVTGATPAYERKGRRDPFQPIEIIQADVKPPAVASARLKGIVRGSAPRALLETPDGMGYILKLGDVLADGRLVEIRADSVVFSVPSRRGPAANHIVLRLPDD